MASYNGARVFNGPGTLYAAPIGTTEPTSVTGAWPAGWVSLGYTEKGNDFTETPTIVQITVDEEGYPIRNTITDIKAEVAFVLAETTAQNLILALNGSIGTGLVAATTGTNADGSVWVEPPDVGSEAKVMIGWDSGIKGATPTNANAQARFIGRQCLQTGGVKISRQKGATYASYSVTYTLEKPATGLEPFRYIFPPSLAS